MILETEYIDLMEEIFGVYSDEQIDSFEETREKGLFEHGFPRLTADLGILLAHKRLPRLKRKFIEMMDL